MVLARPQAGCGSGQHGLLLVPLTEALCSSPPSPAAAVAWAAPSRPPACLPWGHRTSSSKASFLGVPCHLTGLLTYPRSPFPKSVSLPHSEINFLPQGYYLPGASGGGPTLNIHLEYSRAGFMQRWYPLPIGRTWLQTAVSLGSLKGALHTIRQFQFSLVPTTCL